MQTRTDDALATPARDEDEPLPTLFRIVLTLSSVSWGGLALMAQLEQHDVARGSRKRRFPISPRSRGWCRGRWAATSRCNWVTCCADVQAPGPLLNVVPFFGYLVWMAR